MIPFQRRQFLLNSLGLSAIGISQESLFAASEPQLLQLSSLANPKANAKQKEQTEKNESKLPPPLFKLSLSAYSFRQDLQLKAQQKPRKTLEDFIRFAATFPITAVELTEYYFYATDKPYLAKLKALASKLGLDISSLAIRNDFCLIDGVKREQEVVKVRKWLEIASFLGAKTVRIFAGSVPKNSTENDILPICVETMKKAIPAARDLGIYLALENHGGITATPESLLKIVRDADSPWLGINMDTGNFHGTDPYAELGLIADKTKVVQIKTDIQPKGKAIQETDFVKIRTLLEKVSYRGYVVLEYEGKEDRYSAVPSYLQKLHDCFILQIDRKR